LGVFIFAAIASATRNTAGAASSLASTLLNPENINGKKLISYDDKDSYSFLFNSDGTFIYTEGKNTYTGEWKFNGKEKMYRYTIDWTENGKKQGYIADFLKDNGKIILAGHWYLTDAYKPFSRDLKFAQ